MQDRKARSVQRRLQILTVLMGAGLHGTLVVDPLQAHSQPALAAAESSQRTVRPYGLAYRGTGLYLIGYCEMRQEIRTFRGNRILSAEILPAAFTRPADFDLERYLANIWGIEDGPLMQVRIRFLAPVARLARWLVGYGGTVEVLEPAELRQAVINLGRELLARYEG